MKLYTTMPKALKPFYKKEINDAGNAFKKQQYQLSWQHLERAHVLGQPYPLYHTAVHWKMFLFAIKLKNGKEIIGQIPRLLVGGVKSFVGHIPIGNTGGADVPPLQSMKIAADLEEIINSTKTK